jgi:hypothetical protein
MTKDQLLKDLDNKDYASLFTDFQVIPEDLRDSEVAFQWLQSSVTLRNQSSDWALKQIPKHLVNDQIRRLALEFGIRALQVIHPSDTEIYLELVLKATAAHGHAFMMVHESFRTTETVNAILDHDPKHMTLLGLGQQWVKPLLTQEMIDRVGARNYTFAMNIGIQNVAWASAKAMLLKNAVYYPDLVIRGHGDLLDKMIKEGGWPETIKNRRPYKPKGIFELASIISQSQKGSAERHLYCALLKTFPTDRILKAMYTREQRKILLDIYPSEVLLAQAKSNKHLKGMLLEEALGL